MTRIPVKSTATPPEWNGASFNLWQRHLQREIDKIRNTNLSTKYKIK